MILGELNAEQQLRLDCLKLALASEHLDPVLIAKRYEEYVSGRSWAALERRLAAVDAAMTGGTDA